MRYIQRKNIFIVVILSFVVPIFSQSVSANGYGEAKELINEAEAALEQRNEKVFLAKLLETIKIQTTLDDKPYEYGYASYVHLLLAKYYYAKAKKGD
ncbi:MAG: hypothetical protein JW841_18150 [Deltaproteobacteria bacterium]|nr:hypothetical protein [Deltaproteobacteria bacterium]